MKNTVIIQASSRSHGNTNRIIQFLLQHADFDFIDLKEYQIGHYDYKHSNRNDDFIPLAKQIVEKYDTIIFATPVYWYAMSGILKVFFDRITDLLKIEKEIGRQFRGKNMAMISCGSEEALNEGFEIPFSESADYLGMQYLGAVHTWVEEDIIPEKVTRRLLDFLNMKLLKNIC